MIGLLLGIAAFKFVDQDILQSDPDHNDFRNVYFGACAWLAGKQPYDPNVVLQEMRTRDEESYRAGRIYADNRNAVYLPSCFLLVAPLAVLSWNAALSIELGLSVAAFLGFIWACRRRLPPEKWTYFAAFALAFAPFHGALTNINALVAPLLCIAILFIDEFPVPAALLLGICCSLKPQLCVLFVLHLALRRRWKPFAIAAGTGALLLAIGAARLYVTDPSWMKAYGQLVAGQLSPYLSNINGIVNDGAVNFSLFNLQPIAFWILQNKDKAILASYVVFAAMFGLYLVYMLTWYRREGLRQIEGQLWSVVALLEFIAFYQHYYGAICLLLLFLWAIEFWPQRLPKIFTMCGLVLFILPHSKLPLLATMVTEVFEGGHINWGALSRTGLPSAMQLGTVATLAYAAPFFFVIFALFTLLFSLWRQEPPALQSAAKLLALFVGAGSRAGKRRYAAEGASSGGTQTTSSIPAGVVVRPVLSHLKARNGLSVSL